MQQRHFFRLLCRTLQFLALQKQLKFTNAGCQPRSVGLQPIDLQVLLRCAALVDTIVLFPALD